MLGAMNIILARYSAPVMGNKTEVKNETERNEMKIFKAVDYRLADHSPGHR